MSTLAEREIELIRALGRIEGRLAGIERCVEQHKVQMDALGLEFHKHASLGARNGSLYGGLVAAGLAVAIEALKRYQGG